MILEADIIATLKAALRMQMVFNSVAPQQPNNKPSPMPVVIINRASSRWPISFCGTDDQLSMASIQIDYYHETSEGARRLADQGRAALKDPHNLGNEASFYDDFSRAWRVMQTWECADYAPAV